MVLFSSFVGSRMFPATCDYVLELWMCNNNEFSKNIPNHLHINEHINTQTGNSKGQQTMCVGVHGAHLNIIRGV